MNWLESIDVPPRRQDRKPCEHCEASAATCRAVTWLNGGRGSRGCCERCIGDHDAEGSAG